MRCFQDVNNGSLGFFNSLVRIMKQIIQLLLIALLAVSAGYGSTIRSATFQREINRHAMLSKTDTLLCFSWFVGPKSEQTKEFLIKPAGQYYFAGISPNGRASGPNGVLSADTVGGGS
jgi:hypothetical protein